MKDIVGQEILVGDTVVWLAGHNKVRRVIGFSPFRAIIKRVGHKGATYVKPSNLIVHNNINKDRISEN